MPTRHASTALLAAALLLCSSAQAQYWEASRILLAVQGPIVVGKDQNGNEVDRFQRAWVQRSADVLDRIAPELGVTSPRFVIERGTAPNAFAVMTRDGPLVGINTEMLRIAGDDEDMLAAIMGHELAHLNAKHGESREKASSVLGLLGMVVGAAVDISQARKGVSTSGAGVRAGSMGAKLGLAKFTRDQEREADLIGLEAMARSGFDPGAAARMWRVIAARSNGGSGLWLDTHPSNAERESMLAAAAIRLEPVYAAARKANPGPLAAPDPFPPPRYTWYDPTPEDHETQSAYRRGRAAYVEERYEDAKPLLMLAASEGDERANALLGVMAQRGIAAPSPDLEQARQYFEQSAARGFAPAITSLGLMSLKGMGAPPDRARAAQLFKFSADRRDPRGMALLGTLYADDAMAPRNYTKARELAQASADRGDALGKALLGELMRDGLGGPSDPARSFELLTDASRTLPWATYQLGLSYERGLGTPVDKQRAIAAHRAAAAAGIRGAQARLHILGAD